MYFDLKKASVVDYFYLTKRKHIFDRCFYRILANPFESSSNLKLTYAALVVADQFKAAASHKLFLTSSRSSLLIRTQFSSGKVTQRFSNATVLSLQKATKPLSSATILYLIQHVNCYTCKVDPHTMVSLHCSGFYEVFPP